MTTPTEICERLRMYCDGIQEKNELKVGLLMCNEAMLAAADIITSQAAEIERLTKERDEATDNLCKWRSAFQTLTPGGSEFMSVEAVKAWARKMREDTHRASMERHRIDRAYQDAEDRALAAEAALEKMCEALERLIKNHGDHIRALPGEFELTDLEVADAALTTQGEK